MNTKLIAGTAVAALVLGGASGFFAGTGIERQKSEAAIVEVNKEHSKEIAGVRKIVTDKENALASKTTEYDELVSAALLVNEAHDKCLEYVDFSTGIIEDLEDLVYKSADVLDNETISAMTSFTESANTLTERYKDGDRIEMVDIGKKCTMD